jgi:hypothetical protein
MKSGDCTRATTEFEAVAAASLGEFLPDYAWCAVLAGRGATVAGLLADMGRRADGIDRTAREAPLGQRFDEFLARAMVAGLANRHDEALAHLQAARDDRPYTDGRVVPTEYRWADAAFRLYERTRHEPYRAAGVDFARRFATIAPQSAWAYAMVGFYDQGAPDRLDFLATALLLDPRSGLLARLDSDTAAQAQKRAAQGRPLYLRGRKQTAHAPPGRPGLQVPDRGPRVAAVVLAAPAAALATN